MTLLLLLAACERYHPPVVDTGDEPVDSGEPPVEAPVLWSAEAVVTGAIADLVEARVALTSPSNDHTYVLEADGTTIRYVQDTYVYPTGDWCVGGTDDEGVCVRTVTSGRIVSDKPTTNVCLDADGARLFLVKDAGLRLEIVDVGAEGDRPYTYNAVDDNPALPTDVGLLAGPCAWLDATDLLAVAGDAGQVVVMEVTAEATTRVAQLTLPFVAGRLFPTAGGAALVAEGGGRVLRVDPAQGTTPFDLQLGASPAGMAVGDDGVAWLAMGASGAARLDTTDPEAAPVTLPIAGDVRHVVVDDAHGVAWFAVEDAGAWSLVLVQGEEVRATLPLELAVQALAAPADNGDVVVVGLDATGVGAFAAYGLVPDRQTLPPLNIFLFTTIEEPSDAALAEPCSADFAQELVYVRGNAAQLATLGVPVALAISDNFAEKAEECGETAIFQELYDLGFELGVMIHNRPCYNCTSAATDSNADYCAASSPFFIGNASTLACFPDDPDYCGLGDYACYYAALEPRIDLVERNLPGGAAFIVGADRHGMWEYDWLRFYQEVERPSVGKVGFDLTTFVATWAYQDIAYDDPRGKNPVPWRPQDRTVAHRPGDIHAWDEDSAFSSLLYLPGTNSATVKVGEQQATGLSMLDYFEFSDRVVYGEDDYAALWQYLRLSLAYRRSDGLNAWSFHISDLGLPNMTSDDGSPIAIDEVPVIDLLTAFVARVDARYGATGEVQWLYPSEVGALYEDPWE